MSGRPGISLAWRNRLAGAALIAPAVVVLIAIVVFPLVYAVWVSLHDWGLFDETRNFVGLENYVEFAKSRAFWDWVKLMVIYAGVALGAELVLGFALAVLLNVKMRGVGVARTLLVTPVLIAPIVVGLTWRLIMEPSYGILNWLLRKVGLEGPNWVGDPEIAILAVAIADVWEWTPFVVLVLLAGMHAIPQPIDEAAELDGVRAWQKAFFITLPMLKNVILIIILLRGIELLRAFDLIFVMTRGGPGDSSTTLPYATWIEAFQLFRVGNAAALGFMTVVIITIAVMLVIRLFRGPAVKAT